MTILTFNIAEIEMAGNTGVDTPVNAHVFWVVYMFHRIIVKAQNLKLKCLLAIQNCIFYDNGNTN